MKQLQTFSEFMNESNKSDLNETVTNNIISLVFEAETGEFSVTINEGFVADIQLHIRKVIDLLAEKGIKGRKASKLLDTELMTLTQSFQAGDSPEETAEKIL